MSVAGANKVEGTMSWCVGTNEILASNMTALKSQARALWERHLDLRNFFVFYYVWKCLEAQNWNIFMIQTLSRGVARIFQRGGGVGGHRGCSPDCTICTNLDKSVPFTEKWREKYTWNWYQHEFPFRAFRPGKRDKLFKCSVAPGNLPLEQPKKCSIYFPTGFSGNLNGKQP